MTDFANLQRDSDDLGALVNENRLVPTRYGGNKKSWQYLVDQFEAEFTEQLLEINKSRGYRVVGTFAAGFDYELFNDVGIDASGNSWIYVGTGAPVKTVTAGTVPSAPDYQQVTFNSIDGVAGLRDELNSSSSKIETLEQGKRFATDHGIIADGTTNNLNALFALSSAIQANERVIFPSGTIKVDFTGSPIANSDKATFLLDIQNKANVTLEGNGAIIYIPQHNIAVNGGVIFCATQGCSNFEAHGFDFDYTLSGRNNEASKYPWVGAFMANDNDISGITPWQQRNNNHKYWDCSFKMYHPDGSYGRSDNPYNGDYNNAFKIFTIFAYGDHTATLRVNQNRRIEISDCRLLEGHNGYGFWVWAWNNIKIHNNSADAFVTKWTNSDGSFGGRGVPMVRYHQWHCTGITIENNDFQARSSAARTGGYEGGASFVNLSTNLTGDYTHGMSTVTNNDIKLGNGDAVNSAEDYGVEVYVYGIVTITDNEFNGEVFGTANSYNATGVYAFPAGNGIASMLVTDNTFGQNCSYMNNIRLANTSNTGEYLRRFKELIVTDNISYSQSQYFLDTKTGSAAESGFRTAIITNNIIVGTYNQLWDKNSSNSRAIRLAASEALDTLICTQNIVIDKYYGIMEGVDADVVAGRLFIQGNQMRGVTTDRGFNRAGVEYNVLTEDDNYAYRELHIGVGESEMGVGVGSASVKLYQQPTVSYLIASQPLQVHAEGGQRATFGTFGINATGYQANGVTGVSGTATSANTLTITNGIITAIT